MELAEIIKYMRFVKAFKLDVVQRMKVCKNMQLKSYRYVLVRKLRLLRTCRAGRITGGMVRDSVACCNIFNEGDKGNSFFVVAVGRVVIQTFDATKGVMKVRTITQARACASDPS